MIDDAITRYKLVNHAAGYDTAPAEPFLSALKNLSCRFVPRITFYDDVAKARLLFKKREYTVDYDYEEPATMFVSTFHDNNDLIIRKIIAPPTVQKEREVFGFSLFLYGYYDESLVGIRNNILPRRYAIRLKRKNFTGLTNRGLCMRDGA
jgi:hypothetical protein